MDVTNADMERIYANFNEPEPAHIRQANAQAMKDQLAVEMELISNNTCHSFVSNRPFINSNELANELKTEPFNQKAMNDASCAIGSLAYVDTADITNKPWISNYRIRKVLRKARRIGTPSVNGFATLTPFDDGAHRTGMDTKEDDVFVVKFEQDPSREQMTHEVAVGMLATNKLRQIPNFAYIYAGIPCSAGFLAKDSKEPVGWCATDENNVTIAFYEAIAPAVSLKEYIVNCSGAQFLNVYLQAMLAIRFAFVHNEFTHYDLHFENLLVRDLPPGSPTEVTLNFSLPGGEGIYLPVTKIATMIDFGSSFYRYNGRGYGVYGMQKYNTFPDKGHPLFDAYKLLMFCALQAASVGNHEVLGVTEAIFRFFNKTDRFIDAINFQLKYFYDLPYDHRYSIDELLTYISRLFNGAGMHASPEGLPPMFDCSMYGRCMQRNLLKPFIINNLLDFHDAYHGRVRDLASLQRLIAATDWNTLVATSQNDLNNSFNRAQSIMDKLNTYTSLDTSQIDRLESFYIDILSLMDAFINYTWELRLGELVLKATSNEMLRQLTYQARRSWDMLLADINVFYERFGEYDAVVTSLANSITDRNTPGYRWYAYRSYYIAKSIVSIYSDAVDIGAA